ncbi:N-acetyl-D-Glu racemase DgcA [Emcibacter sp.]|uniref:N-acetyl-D-Glu racemase DgcA n=1 Tax=Emcibacter sp. TaxID=1979954 RepID=UPI002AA85C5B|nr:N-acetyl-D-Glu racemase DgcA [Emcibacter sp.]
MVELKIIKEVWPLAGSFNISRVNLTESYVVSVELRDGEYLGRGECEAHESDPAQMDVVEAIIEGLRPELERGIDRAVLSGLLPAGPARNALDCALWDLEAKKSGRRAWENAGVVLDKPLLTAYTIGLDTVDGMAAKAARYRHRELLKVKLNEHDSLERIRSIRQAAPDSRLIVDANEAWTFDLLTELADPFAGLGVELIEQPLPAGGDRELENYKGRVPLCADEACLDRASLSHIRGRYSYINIKLDKTGGLTEALALAKDAQAMGLGIMVGCMTGTSLAMAPAMMIGALAEFCDLDGPLLLARDRSPGLIYEDSLVHIPTSEVWG